MLPALFAPPKTNWGNKCFARSRQKNNSLALSLTFTNNFIVSVDQGSRPATREGRDSIVAESTCCSCTRRREPHNGVSGRGRKRVSVKRSLFKWRMKSPLNNHRGDKAAVDRLIHTIMPSRLFGECAYKTILPPPPALRPHPAISMR